MKYILEFDQEICCDLCDSVIHCHFDCPICNTKYAGTSIYCSIYDYFLPELEFYCEECNARFRLLEEGLSQDDLSIFMYVGGRNG